ncbi:U-box domain-containing protein 44-like [Iris pallida]|uniref:U-box domain-containing protein 44-like n=1 Tax=Iris pallida TaxID=29817 RepID=A0AAX6IDC6_IRIPA|nr:U-box domain-containing protein 44-like [Iris pallida]
MAKANYFKPLLQRLRSDDRKKLMVTTLAEMELTDHSKATLFSYGVLEPLLHLLSHGDADMQKVAVKALHSLSSLCQNGLQMIRDRKIRPLINYLRFQVVSSSILCEQVAGIIMNIAVSAEAIESDDSLVMLESDDDISWLFSLVILAGPNVQISILRTFYFMCKLASAKDMRTKLRQFSAIRVLIPQCEHTDLVVRANAVKLLACLMEDGDDSLLSEHAGQKFFEALLSIIQTSEDEEEIAAAMGIISNFPAGYDQFTQWLLDAEALPNIVRFLDDARLNGLSKNQIAENAARALCFFTVSTNHESQRRAADAGAIPLLVHLLGSGTALTKRYAATSLAQFSESSLGLSKQLQKQGVFCCFSAPLEVVCPVHLGVCSVETSFCLLEADAIKPMVRLLGEADYKLSEAALRALSTLVEDKMLNSGCKAISEANGIGPIVRLLNSQDSDLLEKSMRLLEKIFRLEEYKKLYGASAQMPLVDIAQRESGTIRALAARILAHLDVIHDQSSYF